MKDGIVLHPEHGLNPSIELCIVCGEEMGIALLSKLRMDQIKRIRIIQGDIAR